MKMKLAAVLFSACLIGAAVGATTAFADDVKEPEPAEVAVEAAGVAEDAAEEAAAVEEEAAKAPVADAAEPAAEDAAAPEENAEAEELDDAVLPEEAEELDDAALPEEAEELDDAVLPEEAEGAEDEDIVEPEDAEIPEDAENEEAPEDAEIPDDAAPVDAEPEEGEFDEEFEEEIDASELFELIVEDYELDVKDGFAYYLDEEDNAYITLVEPSEKDEVSLVIPEKLDDHPVIGVSGIGGGPVNLEPEKVTSITLPEGLKFIGHAAFAYMEITSLELPDSLEFVDFLAFAYCSKLEKVYIPKTLKIAPYIPWDEETEDFKPGYIDANAFTGCEKLDEVYYGGSEDQWNSMIKECKDMFVKDMIGAEEIDEEVEAIWKDYTENYANILSVSKLHFNVTHDAFKGITPVKNPATGDDQPTGDNSALGAVLALAVLAGTAVVLTRKKEHLA